MERLVAIAAVLLAACGSGASARSSASPVVSGDACALHPDSTTCRADVACAWYANTRPCVLGQPCPAGWCSALAPAGGGDGGGTASAACACPGAGDDVCVMQIGGPAVQTTPPLACAPLPAGCALADRCACLASQTLGTCRSSDQVTNLCVCDDGIR